MKSLRLPYAYDSSPRQKTLAATLPLLEHGALGQVPTLENVIDLLSNAQHAIFHESSPKPG
jgi:hypothetical protein